eukprot:CFRG2349T1
MTKTLDLSKEVCLHAMFSAQAAKVPDAIALMSKDAKVSYAHLDEASDRLAATLIRHGVKKDSSVGILMERCNEYALAYVAILKAGGAYMPLDPAYPDDLLGHVLENAQPTVVICKRTFVNRLGENIPVVVLDSSAFDFEDDAKNCLRECNETDIAALKSVNKTDLDALAYIVYSSGTTGQPKGIACPHRGAVFSYNWRFDNIPYKDSGEIEGCNVFFVWEMMRPLLRGQTLCVIPDDVIYDPARLSVYIKNMGITRMLFTPSLLESILESKSLTPTVIKDTFSTLTTIILCGEVVKVTLQEKIKSAMPWTRIWNLYSVSECHDVAALDLTDGDYGTRKYCPVGKLMDGVEAIVLDEGTTPDISTLKTTGEQGELYVAGPTLAREYVGKPELTAERFPTLDSGKRLYKTGDRARVLPNRELEILGRNDSMVKIRGYSVELRAIEAAIMDIPDMVSSCVCVVQGDEGEDKFVIAYLVLNTSNEAASCRRVRLELRTKLPRFMIPAYVIDLKELPTHPVSGKLNKKALPSVDAKLGKFIFDEGTRAEPLRCNPHVLSEQDSVTTPRTVAEEVMLRVWCEVMKIYQIDVVFDSFFDIGGHSLIAPALCHAVNAAMEKYKAGNWVEIGVVDLFSHPTVAELAAHITQLNSLATVSLHPDYDACEADTWSLTRKRSLDLEHEVDTHDASKAINDIAMRAFWRSTHFTHVRARSVLMTGATGYLGSYILHELLLNQDIDVVYCIVRAQHTDSTSTSDKDTALAVQARVHSSLKSKGLWQDSFEQRILVFAGDASLYHLGLDDDDFAVLSTGVDMVIHCSALVNLVYPYEGLRSANVVSTKNMIEFALLGKVKRFGYISTDGVFPDGMKNIKETDSNKGYAMDLVANSNGYSQSKWVAEQLVLRASERGLPTVIFRPGNMGGDSGKRGGNKTWNTSDSIFLMLTGCINLGCVPNTELSRTSESIKKSMEWVLEMTPVDFAARAIVNFCTDIQCLGKVYHVTNFGSSLTARETFDALRDLCGYSLELRNFSEWKQQLMASTSPSLARLKNVMMLTDDMEQLHLLSTFNNDSFLTKCNEFGMSMPEITKTVLHEYVKSWQQAGHIKAPVSSGKLLLGKRIAVMGASSGIGAAIATVLSDAGATVGLGGRRVDRLSELATDIMSKTGGKVVWFGVDVTKRDEVKEFVTYCGETMGGGLDVYVNNAGVMHYNMLKNFCEDQWEKEVDVNCKGLLHGIGAVLPGMLERGQGHIIATSSDAGRKVFPGLSVYSGSKFFVEAVCQGLRLETANSGIKVTTIQPGDCKTELSALTTDDEARATYAQASDDRDVWLDPEDIANSVLFAVSAPRHVGINEILVEPRGAPA